MRSPEELLLSIATKLQLPPDKAAEIVLQLADDVDNPKWDEGPSYSWKRNVPKHVQDAWDMLDFVGRMCVWATAYEAFAKEIGLDND